jgi:signal peptidase I
MDKDKEKIPVKKDSNKKKTSNKNKNVKTDKNKETKNNKVNGNKKENKINKENKIEETVINKNDEETVALSADNKQIKDNDDSRVKTIFKELLPFVIIIIAVLFVKNFIMTPIQVNGNSMDGTLRDGDIMILNKISYKLHGIKRFDIVVIKTEDTLLIKRVIGLPNEKVKVENNKLYINGKELEQDFLDEKVETDDFEYTNEDNCYFVMGDNRDVSLDSRDLGCFDISKIQGTTSMTIFPFNRLGKKN